MTSLFVKLELLDDVIFTARAASLGLHECLDYIPGNALLGAVSRTLYAQAKAAQKEWECFHSGALRFGCARPWVATKLPSAAFPVPLSFHCAKGSALADADHQLSTDIQNLASGQDWGQPGTQPVQIRRRWWDGQGSLLNVAQSFRMKSARNEAEFGRSEDSMLFGFTSLRRGSVWLAEIQCDSVVAEFIPMLKQLFHGTQLRLGRSRKAEYGRVKCSLIDAVSPAPAVAKTGFMLRFLVVSDLALCDDFGHARLLPQPADFGLNNAEWTLLPQQTFLRSRSYSPYNAFRKAHDTEREVIEKGSVIVFEAKRGVTVDLEVVKLRVGLHRQEGLGEVLCNPAFLTLNSPISSGLAPAAVAAQPAEVRLPTSLFIARVKARHDAESSENAALDLGRKWAQTWAAWPQGPRKSQWGHVRAEASKFTTLADLKTHFQANVFAASMVAKDVWQGEKRYGEKLLATLASTTPESLALRALQVAAAQIARNTPRS